MKGRTADLIKKALIARRESKQIEFKHVFDPAFTRSWCELIKDLVAIANSGGGIIVFGLDNYGEPTGDNIDGIASIDPADIENKVSKYTGGSDLGLEIHRLEKNRSPLIAFTIQPAQIPFVFEKPGTYQTEDGNQKTAFGVGTIYFRHGAKSEPGTREDIRHVIERQLESTRRAWIKGVRTVVQAPRGAQIVAVNSTSENTQNILATNVRAVNDPNALPVLLTRDRSLATGSFVHEEVSDGIFDEINNVIDANKVLARGQKKFLFGQPVYYRIYAERHHVRQSEEIFAQLLHNGIADFYAPALFWASILPDDPLVALLIELYFHPKNRHILYLTRISLLLGPDFCYWLFEKWHNKWKNHPQPPQGYWTFKQQIAEMAGKDARLLTIRLPPASRVQFDGNPAVSIKDIFDRPDKAATLLSKSCMKVFEGDNDYRTLSRDLDCIAYGPEIQRRASQIATSIMRQIGERPIGDITETVGE